MRKISIDLKRLIALLGCWLSIKIKVSALHEVPTLTVRKVGVVFGGYYIINYLLLF